MRTDEFLSRLEGVKKNGNGWMARCPAHHDRQASLSVTESDLRTLIHCHAGCTPIAVMGALNLVVGDLFIEDQAQPLPRPPTPPAAKAAPEIPPASFVPDEIYEYTDGIGRVIFEVVRGHVGEEEKKFLQRLPGAEEWGGVADIEEKPLYQLPRILKTIRTEPQRRIWIVEGEKDVHAIEGAGGVATTNAGGAGKWSSHYVNYLAGVRAVRIVADKDEPGLRHAQTVSESLGQIKHDIVQAVHGKDAFDHLEGGGTLDDFVAMPKSRGGVSLVRGDMTTSEKIKWVPGYEDFVPYGGITHLAGMPGTNKSTFTCRLAADITKLGKSVFLITSEDSTDSVILPRLIAAGADVKKVFTADRHLTLPRDMAGIEANIDEESIGLLVIDPIDAHLDGDVDSYKNQSIRGALAPLAFMASRLHCAVLLVGHPNKGTRRDPMMRVGGSIGIPGIARSALMMGMHPRSPESSGLRVLASYKGNWAEKPQARIYKVEMGAGGEAIWLSFFGTAKIPAYELLPRGPTEENE